MQLDPLDWTPDTDEMRIVAASRAWPNDSFEHRIFFRGPSCYEYNPSSELGEIRTFRTLGEACIHAEQVEAAGMVDCLSDSHEELSKQVEAFRKSARTVKKKKSV